ncbi:MAG: radical SAM protein [Chloroflexi bacterium]|nr:radical SAM protein [Chloroflexota bacterium]
MRSDSYPAYLSLAASGELKRRADAAVRALAHCRVCPRDCQVDRLHDRAGTCRIGRWARVASYFPHIGEEDCLRGWRGSGTIFFSGCNLRCVFCQNWDISHGCEGQAVSPERLAAMMLELQELGCHNINWVTPEHVVPQALEALALAAENGLRLPIVYNTSAHDSLDSLRWLDGVVDIYMPDFKIWDSVTAARLLQARHYPETARQAIREMHRQVGDLTVDQHGLAHRGLLIRHLVMPNGLAGTREIAAWLARDISAATYINVMAQYHPAGQAARSPAAARYADIARGITADEFRAAMADARAAGLQRFDERRLN